MKKITQVGLDLNADSTPKDPKYEHTLNFATNNSILLHCGTTPIKDRKKITIDESNHTVE